MRRIAFTALIGAACLGLAGCDADRGEAGNASAAAGNDAGGGDGSASASASWPKGARIVEENGATFRVDPDGSRVRLTDRDARIVVENGVRYRVDPVGSRVRIDDQGLDVDVDLPDVDVGINEKGNPDIDINGGDVDVSTNKGR